MVFTFSDLSDEEVFEGKFLLLSQKEILLPSRIYPSASVGVQSY